MSEFSFTSFLNSNGGSNKPTNGANALRPASPNQRKFYLDLCERKRVRPEDVNSFTFDQMGKEIEMMQKLPDPASARQIEKILELQEELISLGSDLKPMSKDFLDSLTGGREGTASSLINSLFEMRTRLNEIAPATDAQIKIMVEWFLCPDIPFEDFKIEKKVYLDKLSAYCSDHHNPELLEKRAWRLVTPTEFAGQIKAKMTKREASKFIDDYRGVFYDWRKTRTTKQQVDYIRELESRLADTYVPAQVEYAIVDGEIQQVTKPSSRIQYNATAYTPLEDMQLAQMSFEQASEWIDRLKSEVARKNSYQSMHNEEEVFGTNQQDFEEKYTIVQENKRVAGLAGAKLQEFNKLNDLIYSVEAILGYESQEAHDMVSELLMEDTDSATMLNHKDRLKEFFMSTVTADQDKDETRWRSEMARIFNMCEDVPTALEILAS